LYVQDFPIQKMFNMLLKLKKYLEHIRFTFEEIKPCQTTISIDKANIIFMSTNRGLGRTPNIQKYNIKW
jgi:hypothetical protein